jgi:hypothetical protein
VQLLASTFRERSFGQEMVGEMLSSTVTVKEQVAVLPELSVAVAVTVVVPRLNALPRAGEYAIPEIAQLSVAVAV